MRVEPIRLRTVPGDAGWGVGDAEVRRCEACSILVGRGYLCSAGFPAPDGRGILCCACARALEAASRRGRDPYQMLAEWRRALADQDGARPRRDAPSARPPLRLPARESEAPARGAPGGSGGG